MSSMSSFLNTTLPGVAAMFSPSLKWLVSPCRGRPPLRSRSSTKFPAPTARLAPPVSIARLIAAGLVSRKFVGARASSRKSAASPAFASATASPAPAARMSPASWIPARYACRSAKNPGLSFHEGSANRLSARTGTGGSASAPSQRAAATGPIRARLVQYRNVAAATSAGCRAARVRTLRSAPPRPGPRQLPPRLPRPPPAWSCSFEDRGNALAAADTHGDQRVPAGYPPELVQGLDYEDGTGSAEWVTERDTASVRVGFLRRQAELADDGARLRGERL